PAFDEYAATGDWAAAIRAAIGEEPPAGLVWVRIAADGGLDVRTGPARIVLSGGVTEIEVVVDSAADREAVVRVAGSDLTVPPGGAEFVVLEVRSDSVSVVCGEQRRDVTGVVVPAPAAELLLTSPDGARWSVRDHTGGAWFPPGVPQKWDAADRPFFHTDPGTTAVAVPAVPLAVVAARGLEFERREVAVEPVAGGQVSVDYAPVRRFDPAASGWFGGDLHVHLNYSGDHVLSPAAAARMQRGEALHLLHLTAGNFGGALVYDRELLETTAGDDLWCSDAMIGRAGLEFRNDLLGHVHGLGLTGVPGVLHTGHEGTSHPWDWPPNAAACARMRELDAVTTYAHPVFAPGDEPDDEPDDLFRPWRMVEARELVADAALGLVDAIELASCFDDRGAVVLYHHLLSCGLRLAATAGTDTFLSFAHGPATASGPPGWCRVYAQLRGATLSVERFASAVRAGRTTVTNGPWLELDVGGRGPGDVVELAAGDRLRVRARVTGSGVDRLVLHGPDGELAATASSTLEHEVVAGDGGLWIAAAAYGGREDPYTVGAPVFAHTSPVHVEVGGRRVARAASARWCLRMLDGVQQLAAEQGRFDPEHRERQLGDLTAVLDRAREFYDEVLRTAR
ncbi:MAG TPA: CehA/McbA family metallohydrolase, partial [Kineosporiaceae bacterium]|nr:CehA/McbA family metallohydrolase [Kineosporiaceae bacterium]